MMWHTSLGAAAAVFSLLTSQVVGREDVQIEPQTAQIVSTKGVILDTILDWNDAARLDHTTYNGQKYGCKCYPGRPCWPSANKWNSLNRTVDGTLHVNVPAGAVCHNTFDGPFGTIQTYDEAACADAKENFVNEQWTVEKPADGLWTYFTNDTCRPTSNPSDPCTLGSYGVYVIMATKASHIQAGVNFARQNNLRLIVRNTGHDFLGRSVGYGSLIINTHSFQSLKWTDKYTGPGSYRGPAVTMGAGVQGGDILKAGHALNPPMALVTGECATVGLSGGFIQGGGHGPWTTLKGLAVDNVLNFEVITASGLIVNANEWQNPDLFIALRGGGPASYGVILSTTVKTFPDLPAAGATLYLNATHTSDNEVIWVGTKIFHKYANHFVDNGLYVYFEIFPNQFRVRPFVAIGKSQVQLQDILRPMLDEFAAARIPYEAAFMEFPTFYDLYIDLFEAEKAGQTALTGGWMFNHDDVANRNDEIIAAMKNVVSPAGRPDLFGGMVGHLFNPGHNVPVSTSAAHPAWRNATDFVIAVLPSPEHPSLAVKKDLQNVLTNNMDEGFRNASRSGATYVNEADPFQPNWQSHFWGSNYPRLKQLRKKWDPLGVFYAVSTPGTEDWEEIEFNTRLCKKL
ncbi:hypothetical protein NEUTE1DRAFT_146918 [Neurospora tetrasperma FGSC 2508]|uniref:FAD-binding PCMH-type domain-containing protein n=1 Tax=Neurospora tetrasperma (strain FGSC 2508 / ATCC MYA-4615 / P0657) TaxID=510951 RepID=F8MNP3_NEUT8|nr:uncharacterized protein NEUTE1DRAFT_146918 [Neurospora tetrasperma FGSC 2508]EGO56165.1 hypothetical protein NEUTE1DRAFT_146918 [Neurospora tetrasperma FGSC 2508]EGZ70982.1 FAD-binding domain-containing protein [Neurospora tetrasperma FGSC 2509]